jgi:hypothetical protein
VCGSYGYFLYTYRHHFRRAARMLDLALEHDNEDTFSWFVKVCMVGTCISKAWFVGSGYLIIAVC